jgi:peptidoglycan hydrolase-like protein with peptidoglycan-binding domain
MAQHRRVNGRADARDTKVPGRHATVQPRGWPGALLHLQAAAGNRAVSRLLSRAGAPTGEVPGAAPGAKRLTSPRFVGDPLLEACLQDRARLSPGARGLSVAKVQQALVDLDYDLGPAGADMVYGAKTATAVRAFKRDQALGFEQFGDVGPGTMGRLDELFPGEPNELPNCHDLPIASGGKAIGPSDRDAAIAAPVIPGVTCNLVNPGVDIFTFGPVRGAATPAGTPDRIPPRVDTPVSVTIAGGKPGIPTTIRAKATNGTSGDPGSVLINGKPTDELSASGTVQVRGTSQTLSIFVNQLRLVAEQGGREVASSKPFGVTSLPTGIDIKKDSDSGRGEPLRGMIVTVDTRSDSGERADLDLLQIKEILQSGEQEGSFKAIDPKTLQVEASGYGLANRTARDKHRVKGAFLTGPGIWRVSQIFVFRDLRTGVTDVPVPHSAFMITFSVGPFTSGSGLMYIVTKVGLDTTAQGLGSTAGFGSAFTVQEV